MPIYVREKGLKAICLADGQRERSSVTANSSLYYADKHGDLIALLSN